MCETPMHRQFSLIGLTALALLVCACEDSRLLIPQRMDNATAVGVSDPALRHPIGFTSRAERLDVEVPPAADGLSPNQHVDVYRFLALCKREATGRLAISVPAGVRDRAAMRRALGGIEQHVNQAGISYRVVRGPRHDRRSSGTPFIRLAYQRPVTVPPPCDHWAEDVGRNEERIPYPNWGCATQRNLAVMVDNARDLSQPQAEDPRAGERRSVSWSAYVGRNVTHDPSGEEAKRTLVITK